jgi:ABC-type antimicrobial peptide transport system permease subunit
MWLIAVSFLVCIVGIANAMLMSVTERFREIATMKCLGATDGFIMINFILESILQGVAGSIAGGLLGFLLGTVRAWVRYGSIAIVHFPLGDIFAALGISFAVGVVISAMAAVYPAWVAARLAPMEAMRIE